MDISLRIQLMDPTQATEMKKINTLIPISIWVNCLTMQASVFDLHSAAICERSNTVRSHLTCNSSFFFGGLMVQGLVLRLFVCVSVSLQQVCVCSSMKVLQGENKSYLSTQRGCKFRDLPTKWSLSHTPSPIQLQREREGGKKHTHCLFQLSESVSGKSVRWGRFLGGNRGITVSRHTPKYLAYRDINRSRGEKLISNLKGLTVAT